MESVDCVVIGAGVVGLAAARELALRGRDVIVLETEEAIGVHASSRNTGVIHAGLDYKAGSLKGRLCLEGRDLLYAYCRERRIAHRQLGKIIPARPNCSDDELQALRAFADRAVANGCGDVVWLNRADIRRIEPELSAVAALFSPQSGIVDQHEFMNALWGDLTNCGGHVAFGLRVIAGAASESGIELTTAGRDELKIKCAACVNAAGAGAQHLSRAIVGIPLNTIPPRLLQKGSYAVFAGGSPFSHLVYPFRHGLHASLDMAGQLRFGPDAEWVEHIDYTFDQSRMPLFYDRVREFWPSLREGELHPGWTAVRSKVSRQRAPEIDFVIQDARVHGVHGLVNLYGIESPGFTSSLAIAREIADRI